MFLPKTTTGVFSKFHAMIKALEVIKSRQEKKIAKKDRKAEKLIAICDSLDVRLFL